jgi:PAS domain S-box-containing protein
MYSSAGLSRSERLHDLISELTDMLNAIPEDQRQPVLAKLNELDTEVNKLVNNSTALYHSIRAARTTSIQLEATINSVTAGVLCFDHEGRVRTANSSMIALFGFDPIRMSLRTIFKRLTIKDEKSTPLSYEQFYNSLFPKDEVLLNLPLKMKNTLGRQISVLVSTLPLMIGRENVGKVTVWNNITERERLLDENRRQNELLEAIFQADPGAIAVVTLRDTVCQKANYAFQAATSHPDINPIGKTISQIWLQEETRKAISNLLSVVETGQNGISSFQAKDSTGSKRFLEAHARRISWNGEPAMLVVIWETTLLQQALETARQQKREAEEGQHILKALMEYIPEGITIADAPDVNIRYVSKHGQILTGRSQEEITGIPMQGHPEHWQIYDPISLNLVSAEDLPLSQATLTGQVIENKELIMRQASGECITILCNAGPILDKTGNITGGILAWRDITERKHLQENIEQSEARFRIAMLNTPITVFTMDNDLRYSWIYNARHGTSEIDSIGKRDDELTPPDDVKELVALKQSVITSGVGTRKEIAIKVNGDVYNYDLTLEPLRDEFDRVIGLAGAALDITDQRRLEARQIEYATQMEVQRRLLEHREMERQQIARDLHDGPIQSTIALMFSLQAAVESEQEIEIKNILSSASDEAQNLVSELRIVCNDLRPPTVVQFGLAKSIRSHITEYQQRIPHIRFWLDLAEDGKRIPDSARLALFRIYQQSLINVIRHADAKEVRIGLAMSQDSVTLEISDDGKGFALPEDWVDLARRNHFGLVGIKERAEAIGGKIAVRSSPGKGTTVRVEAPLTSP